MKALNWMSSTPSARPFSNVTNSSSSSQLIDDRNCSSSPAGVISYSYDRNEHQNRATGACVKNVDVSYQVGTDNSIISEHQRYKLQEDYRVSTRINGVSFCN